MTRTAGRRREDARRPPFRVVGPSAHKSVRARDETGGTDGAEEASGAATSCAAMTADPSAPVSATPLSVCYAPSPSATPFFSYSGGSRGVADGKGSSRKVIQWASGRISGRRYHEGCPGGGSEGVPRGWCEGPSRASGRGAGRDDPPESPPGALGGVSGAAGPAGRSSGADWAGAVPAPPPSPPPTTVLHGGTASRMS